MFVDACRQCSARGGTQREALDTAVDYCIDHGILADFLRLHRSEVLGMLLEEFDVGKYERTIKAEGTERANQLTRILLEQNRTEDLRRAAGNPEYQEQLFREFNL